MPGCRYKSQGVLAALVECLWYWEGAPGPHLQERLLPNGGAAMILNLREDAIAMYEDDGSVGRYGHVVLSGPRSNCFTIDCNQQERVVGVQFRPGGAFPFFRVPVSALEGASFDMGDLWGQEAGWVRERVLAERTRGQCYGCWNNACSSGYGRRTVCIRRWFTWRVSWTSAMGRNACKQ
jgi:hypothetical protein